MGSFSFTEQQLATLNAVADRIVPPDQTLGAAEAGAANFILSLLNGELCGEQITYISALDAIEQESQAYHGKSFAALSAEQQDGVLREIEADRVKTTWLVPPLTFFPMLVEQILEGFYADPGQRREQRCGFMEDGRLPRRRGHVVKDFDVIIIGAGAAGGIAAAVLAEAGKRVLLVERGGKGPTGVTGRDHLRNQRLSVYGHNAGPDLADHPRVAVDAGGKASLLRPHEGGYQNNAACVGAGTRVYGGMAWRFMPEDFRMASEYGIPAGSSLADWPIGYDDLEPFYERAEWEIGVAGLAGADVNAAPRKRGIHCLPSNRTWGG